MQSLSVVDELQKESYPGIITYQHIRHPAYNDCRFVFENKAVAIVPSERVQRGEKERMKCRRCRLQRGEKERKKCGRYRGQRRNSYGMITQQLVLVQYCEKETATLRPDLTTLSRRLPL